MVGKIRSFTPREIVSELDRYIVGQDAAKRAVAIALRNRWRRQQVEPRLREEISPKNIILIGPTGCGKTEIARRLAKLADAPFVKVEATKFTEVGYVGRDVDSMVRDLVEVAVKMCKEEALQLVNVKAQLIAEERVLDLLMPPPASQGARLPFDAFDMGKVEEEFKPKVEDESREKLRDLLRTGKFNEREVTIEVRQATTIPMMQMFGQPGMEDMASNLQDALQNALGGGKKKQRKVKIVEALELISAEEAQRLIDMDQVHRDAVTRAEQSGIIFVDEIDKVAGRKGGGGPDVSREGVQRDILPIVEGSAVATKYGIVRTDHVLFIAAGAFHISKPTDLIPELQGRFPIRVELEPLTEKDFERILKEPENSLVKQYTALLLTEKVEVNFTNDGIKEIAKVAAFVNASQENIGARRLYTVMEKLLEEESFSASDRSGTHVEVTGNLVCERLAPILQNEDLSKFIL
jgi:ATP-dependent HslUV protease ATP-binding subunit HslU